MLRLAAVVFLILALPLRANLGDTVAESIKRYGKPDRFSEATPHMPFGTVVYSAGPYQMMIFLFNNMEVGARVTKKDKSAFSPAEIQTILNADAPTPWAPSKSDDPTSPEWTRADKATAAYDSVKNVLIFTTPEMQKELDAAPAAPAAPAPAPAPLPPNTPGNFAPAGPTTWLAPAPPSTNAPATNAP